MRAEQVISGFIIIQGGGQVFINVIIHHIIFLAQDGRRQIARQCLHAHENNNRDDENGQYPQRKAFGYHGEYIFHFFPTYSFVEQIAVSLITCFHRAGSR